MKPSENYGNHVECSSVWVAISIFFCYTLNRAVLLYPLHVYVYYRVCIKSKTVINAFNKIALLIGIIKIINTFDRIICS